MHDNHHEETRIRELQEEFENALKAKDLDRIIAQYDPDVVAFDAIGALQFVGLADYRAHWERCFEHCQGEGFFRDPRTARDGQRRYGVQPHAQPLRRAQCRGPDADCLDARQSDLGQARRSMEGDPRALLHAVRRGDRPGMHVAGTVGRPAADGLKDIRRASTRIRLPAASFSSCPADGERHEIPVLDLLRRAACRRDE